MRVQEAGMIRNLFRLSGEVSRRRYLVTGLLLFAVKYTLDYLLTAIVFGRPWRSFPYLSPLGEIGGLSRLAGADQVYAASMIAMALPFMWIGAAMTLRRARSAGAPSALVILFFVSIINLLLIGVFCLLPEKDSEPDGTAWRISAAYAFLIGVAVSFGVVLLGSVVLKSYGLGLFVALPFCLGFLSVLIYNSDGDKSSLRCMGISSLSVVIPGVALLAFAMEGLGCLVMALPLALPLAWLGGAIAWSIQNRAAARQGMAGIVLLLILYPPAVMCAEYVIAPEPPLIAVRTSVDIDAPPDTVWRHVVSFAELPPPNEWIFQTGIAYPVRATIEGAAPGAIRRCEFSTGPFIEPIEVWDAPRLLQFAVTQNPAPMEEWTPYNKIEPAHLNNFLVSRKGQFLLTALPGGRTHLEGTTWYTHNLWPGGYWQAWSDFIIHRIRQRVLVHIKKLAES
jgi:uncharacterized membrane protein YhaH (DUF805 family)